MIFLFFLQRYSHDIFGFYVPRFWDIRLWNCHHLHFCAHSIKTKNICSNEFNSNISFQKVSPWITSRTHYEQDIFWVESPLKKVHSEICGLSIVTTTLFLDRHFEDRLLKFFVAYFQSKMPLGPLSISLFLVALGASFQTFWIRIFHKFTFQCEMWLYVSSLHEIMSTFHLAPTFYFSPCLCFPTIFF